MGRSKMARQMVCALKEPLAVPDRTDELVCGAVVYLVSSGKDGASVEDGNPFEIYAEC